MRNSCCKTWCVLLVFVAGCGAKDLDKAQEAVEASLRSWKKGETPQQLAAQAIEIADPDWMGGWRLLDYTVKNATSQPQQGPRVVVVLQLQDGGGKTTSTEVAYEVILADKVKIGRDAFHIGP